MDSIAKAEYSLEVSLKATDDYMVQHTIEDTLDSLSDISANISDARVILDYVLAYCEV